MVVGHNTICGVRIVCKNNIVFRGVLNGIDSLAAKESVSAAGAIHRVVAVSTVEDIVSGSCNPAPPNITVPIEGIITVPASEGIVTCAVVPFVIITDDEVITRVSFDGVITIPADKSVVTRTTLDGIVA